MKLNYQDSIILVDPVIDKYGTEKIGRMETVKAIVGQATGYAQSNNQAAITSDAIAYLNHEDAYVLSIHKRLEGMFVIISEGELQADSWYRITSVAVGRRSLTSYTVDNVQVNLSKSAALVSVS